MLENIIVLLKDIANTHNIFSLVTLQIFKRRLTK